MNLHSGVILPVLVALGCNAGVGAGQDTGGAKTGSVWGEDVEEGDCSDLERAVKENPDNEEYSALFEEYCDGSGDGSGNGIIIIVDADGNVVFAAVLGLDCDGGGRIIFADGGVTSYSDLPCALAHRLLGLYADDNSCKWADDYEPGPETQNACLECIAKEMTERMAGRAFEGTCSLAEAFQIRLNNIESIYEVTLARSLRDIGEATAADCEVPCPVDRGIFLTGRENDGWLGDDLLYWGECAEFCAEPIYCGAGGGGAGSCGSYYYLRDPEPGSGWYPEAFFDPELEETKPPEERREYEATQCMETRVGASTVDDVGDYDPKIFLCCPSQLDGVEPPEDEWATLCSDLI